MKAPAGSYVIRLKEKNPILERWGARKIAYSYEDGRRET